MLAGLTHSPGVGDSANWPPPYSLATCNDKVQLSSGEAELACVLKRITEVTACVDGQARLLWILRYCASYVSFRPRASIAHLEKSSRNSSSVADPPLDGIINYLVVIRAWTTKIKLLQKLIAMQLVASVHTWRTNAHMLVTVKCQRRSAQPMISFN
jgi:hypothetical protein